MYIAVYYDHKRKTVATSPYSASLLVGLSVVVSQNHVGIAVLELIQSLTLPYSEGRVTFGLSGDGLDALDGLGRRILPPVKPITALHITISQAPNLSQIFLHCGN